MYNGKCPFCSGQLYEVGDELRCMDGHYHVDRAVFERRWMDFDMAIAALKLQWKQDELTMEQFHSMESELIEQLLKDLQSANLLPKA